MGVEFWSRTLEVCCSGLWHSLFQVKERIQSTLAQTSSTISASTIFPCHQNTLQSHVRQIQGFLFYGNSFKFHFLKYTEAMGSSSQACNNTPQMAREAAERQEDKLAPPAK